MSLTLSIKIRLIIKFQENPIEITQQETGKKKLYK